MVDTGSEFIAHVSEDGERRETVLQHLMEVADMASEFAAKFGNADWAYAAGLLHDVGKYSAEFQRRVLHEGPRVDHATAGAYLATTECKNPLLAYCIAGHHGGLPDGGVLGDTETTLNGRLYKAKNGHIPDYSAFSQEVAIPKVTSCALDIDQSRLNDQKYCYRVQFSQTLFTRMLYSCLVDADYLCTERFMRGEDRERPSSAGLASMREDLEAKLAAFYPPRTRINEIRCGVLDDCRRMAQMPPGVFSLTVPTGGGKTFAMMRFALHHATAEGRLFDRVICVEPYTSIIEQNAEVYREVFGEDQVLEHHSNYNFEKHVAGDAQNDDSFRDPMRLAAENWDVPLVVTTNVQLFESLFASKPSRCRKLHNIARSVILLDEAQMIPTKYLEPCVAALSELVKRYGCTVVLCTATQPVLNELFEQEGLEVQEIASNPKCLVHDLRRVNYHSLGEVSDNDLVDRMADSGQALCIVNSRRQARRIYDLLVENSGQDRGTVFHLSTLMHPRHRSRVVKRICDRISNDASCLVVSTSLVEAGVDIDFGTVIRAVAGVDSMVQAAGRCNREMKRLPEESAVYLFEPADRYAIPRDIMQSSEVARSVEPRLREGSANISLDSIEVIQRYFTRLHGYRSLDEKDILKRLSRYGMSGGVPTIPFSRVSSEFQIVENGSYAVIIPSDENEKDIESLLVGDATRSVMRRLGHWIVNVYKSDRDALLRSGAIEPIGEYVFLLGDPSRYSEETGLDLLAEGGEAVFL